MNDDSVDAVEAAVKIAEADAREAGRSDHANEIRQQYKAVRNWLASNGLNKPTVIEMINKRVGEVAEQYINHHMTTGWLSNIVDRAVTRAVTKHVEDAVRIATARATATVEVTFHDGYAREKIPKETL